MFNKFLDILFPKKCINCGKEGTFFCEDCISLVDINPNYYCLCSKPKILNHVGKCGSCRHNYLDGLLSASSFKQELIKKSIHKLKYDYLKNLSLPLSFIILSHLLLLENNFSNFLLIPVPLSDAKKKRRGFNQSEEIAKYVSKALNVPLLDNVLIKIKNTKSQVDLNRNERIKNIKNCFMVRNNQFINNKNIILLDDVYTTGSTMNECARILKENGTKQVIGLTISRELEAC